MRIRFRGVLAAILAGGTLIAPVIAQSSANYRMEHVVLVAGAARLASPTWEMSLTITPDSRTGASSRCNTGLRVSLGFPDIAGAIPVPIELSLGHSSTDPRDVELTWTGADPRFQVYRGSSPHDISSPVNLYEETGLCTFTDLLAYQEPILFYLVVPRP